MKRLLGALVLASFASLLAAAEEGPNRKTWAASPEAYFLTSEERAAWKNVGTDEQASSSSRATWRTGGRTSSRCSANGSG
ncbi:MAG: hypothetical protein ABJC61_05510 [Acidobacteriota bacterium]